MKEDCIFCKIAQGEIPSKTVYEDKDYRAILDIAPAEKGHVIILSKSHSDDMFDLSEAEASKVFLIAKRIGQALKDTLHCDGINILQNNGSVYGASFDSLFMVRHTCAKTTEERNQQRGSKYVQSDINHIFKPINDDLNNGLQVLLTGTPCQIAAILGFLENRNTNMDKLITCDIICHGVCSPMIWEKYLEYIKERYGGIRNINFRDKKIGSGYNMTIDTTNALYQRHENQDPFIKIFELNYALRPSCFNCEMKTINRLGDITIGDFHKAKQYFPEYNDGSGISVVFINSEKGKNFFETTKGELEYKECVLEQAMQPNLYMQIELPKEREKFFDLISRKPFIYVMKKYTELGFKNYIFGSLKRVAKKILKR